MERTAWRECAAQATVEMAIVAPVLIVLALIVFNIGMFLSATARFDRVVPDIVVAHGASPDAGTDGTTAIDASAAIVEQVKGAMEGYDVQIEVTRSDGDSAAGDSILSLVGSLRTYTCTMRYAPWPSGLSIAGVSMGAPAFLSHSREVTIDPWRPGVIV